jgi:hypothetical protein
VIQFVNPIWLAAGAAIVVPVILHMWNDRRGKLLRIGSVALLTGGTLRMAWRRRVSQWLLLLVRCLLLLASAVLLARPYFGSGGRVKGWVLTVGAGGGVAGGMAGGLVADSLGKAGWERHVFQDSNNYWEGFRMADRMAPAGVPFYIRTPAQARRFGGERPVTAREVRWDVYTPVDPAQRWVEAAWVVSPDSIRVVEGLSRATGTAYSAKTIAVAARPDSVVVDTSVFRVAIFADAAYRQDSRYVKAAVMALRDFSGRRIEILEGTGVVGDWLFWLSDRPLPDMRGYRHVFQYMSGKERVVHTRVAGVEWMKEVEGSGSAGRGSGSVDRGSGAVGSGSVGSGEGVALWRDGYGRGVLEKSGERYEFYGRLSADWNGLVWSGAFPVLLEKLLFRDVEIGEKDRRVLDLEQIVPLRGGLANRDVAELRAMVKGTGGEGMHASARDAGVAAFLFWIVVFLFILERILVNGKQTT